MRRIIRSSPEFPFWHPGLTEYYIRLPLLQSLRASLFSFFGASVHLLANLLGSLRLWRGAPLMVRIRTPVQFTEETQAPGWV